MAAKEVLPFGTWPSPVTPQIVARGSRRFGTIQAAGGAVYWSESRPEEGGRQVVLRTIGEGEVDEVLPRPFSARSRVHEYGGGEFLVADGTLYFVNDKDQQVYRIEPDRSPQRITHAQRTRFADFAHDAQRRRLIAVAEVHPPKASATAIPRNLIAGIALAGKRSETNELATGRDFYASPRLSPDGRRLAFLAWDLPDMPWDSGALYVADVGKEGGLDHPVRIAGGGGSAVFQPEWGPDGTLYFVSDETGWGQLYRWQSGRVLRVHGRRGAELMRPQWVFGARSYAVHPDGRIGLVSLSRGQPQFEVLTPISRKAAHYAHAHKRAARIDDPVAINAGFAALVSLPAAAPAITRVTANGLTALSPPPPIDIEPGNVSNGEVREFRRPDGETVFSVYYAPKNVAYRGPNAVAPPALVLAHGGPTSMTDAGFKARIQFYTSRGFAVLDVNYSGSTGYGRAYRQRLDGQWGIADVADCAAGARYLAQAGLADANRIAIAGGSAGGYTTLMALATTDIFAAGSSHYGVSDLALLLAHTHKFESGYLHRLMGTTPSRWKAAFAARSPINLIGGIKAPVILFQGLDDKVVPPEQSRRIVDELQRRGVDVAYHEFAGEAHGFRKAETIVAVLEAELAFLNRALRLVAPFGLGAQRPVAPGVKSHEVAIQPSTRERKKGLRRPHC
jgi:dipeptidyl aminopeptidase/acylaminoacyl peptidase